MPPTLLTIRGARENNLAGIDLDLPRGTLIAIAGVSGSGKSSLAFDTIFREGQRRFLETLSPAARGLLGTLERGRVERIEGLSPALALDQRARPAGRRSTVATLAELQDHLGLLYARLGTAHCPRCHRKLAPQSSTRIAERILCAASGRRCLILAPLVSARRGAHRQVLDRLGERGFVRVRLDGEVRPLDEVGALAPARRHTIEAVIDRLIPALEKRTRLFDAVEAALELSGGLVTVVPAGGDELTYCAERSCPECRIDLPELEPRIFSFRSPRGACASCGGSGRAPDDEQALCPACEGTRLQAASRAVLWRGNSLPAVLSRSVREALALFEGLELAGAELAIGGELVEEICTRLRFLERVGLGYLELDREGVTLAGGEAQRIRLATQLGSGLREVLYILDEPSAGLHPAEVQRLIAALLDLRDGGNTVIVVEHDAALLSAADHLVELGPGAGARGGRILASGAPAQIAQRADTPTGRVLAAAVHPSTFARRSRRGRPSLLLRGASGHNLRCVDLEIPLGLLVGICGVSGSGKTSLLRDTLCARLRADLHGAREQPLAHAGLNGSEHIDKVVLVDQRPIGRSLRSTVASYSGLLGTVRALLAATAQARMRGFGKGRFSPNVPAARGGGRCEVCRGAGLCEVDLRFAAPLRTPCDACGGLRFTPETLAIHYGGHSIAGILALSVDEGLELLRDVPAAARILRTLRAVGLGYLLLGQCTRDLSGGEAQRLRLAAELGRPAAARTLYLLDEPTLGLHAEDVSVLLEALQELVEAGHTVIVIEHDLGILAQADHLIDLGPGGGREGGRILACGSPEEVAQCAASITGAHLARLLGVQRAGRAPTASARPARRVPGERAPTLHIVGARRHNLRNLDVELPREALTVLTGVSGSGKTSLALETIFTEGRRRFLESLSTRQRRLLGKLERAPLDRVDGLGPAIAVDARGVGRNPRSSVATSSGILAMLRVLFARAAISHCPEHHLALRPITPSQIAREAIARWPGRRGYVTAPLFEIGGELPGDELGAEIERRRALLLAQGFVRLLVGGREQRIDGGPVPLPRGCPADAVELILDRVDFAPERGARLVEALESAERVGRGRVAVVERDWGRERRTELRIDLSVQGACPRCGYRLEAALEPRDFSFNTRAGACPRCAGSGLEEGDGQPCSLCEGSRLKPASRWARLDRWRLEEILSWTVARAIAEFQSWRPPDEEVAAVAAALVPGLLERLRMLERLGLSHLALDRRSASLSSGEGRRLRLAAALGARLAGVIYVLDEPTVGLHPSDTERLLGVLEELRGRGNTLIVVEHDEEVIERADHLVELGPGAGQRGGRVVASGSHADLRALDTPTGRLLRGELAMRPRAPRAARGRIVLEGACTHNLRGVDLHLELGQVTVVSGVSGAGKSSLVFGTLVPALRAALAAGAPCPAEAARWKALRGAEQLDRVQVLDPLPPQRAGSGNPATYCGVFDAIRRLFARVPEARARGFTPAAFGTGTRAGGGGCPACGGAGALCVDRQFLSDVWIECEECSGRRFRSDVLAIRYRGRSIADVLAMEVGEAREFFTHHRSIRPTLEQLERVGLGYLRLGQPTATLSGGEVQRLKVARELAAGRGGRALYAFDEPTIGLHAEDVLTLIAVLDQLAAQGHAVVVLEHNPMVIAAADRVVDLGPGGGDAGGRVVFEGPPAELLRSGGGGEQSSTARFLRKKLTASRAGTVATRGGPVR